MPSSVSRPSKGAKTREARAAALIKRASFDDAPVFRSVVETEFKAMTEVGNKLRIRHFEVGHEPVGETGERDYLFMRLYSLIWLMLKRTPTVRMKRCSDRPMAMARKKEKPA